MKLRNLVITIAAVLAVPSTYAATACKGVAPSGELTATRNCSCRPRRSM